MSTKQQQRLSSVSLLLLVLAFIAAVIISNQLFKGWRFDLTDNKLYTLSDGTESILGNIDEPINLYFYFSDQASANIPTLRAYANRIEEMLQEFEDAADGKINLRVIDPLPFSEDEDRATQFGLQGVRLGNGPDPIYMGLAGTDSVDNESVIPFFQPDKEAFLEYDLAKMVSTLANPARTVVGLVSGVEMSGSYDPQSGQTAQPWVVYQQAQQLFEIRNLGTTFDEIPDEVSLLWIVQPKNIANNTMYAIDQFIMRGGRALIFVDPIADADPIPQQPGMPAGMPPMGQGSDLPALFEAWGIEFSSTDVVSDAQLALQISNRNGQPMRHFGYLGVTASQLNTNDIVTSDLNSLNFATAGSIAAGEDSPATVEALMTSSDAAALIAATRFSYLPDPSVLQDGFEPSGENYILAARVSGTLPSAFPNGALLPAVSSEDGDVADESADPNHLAESTEPVNVIVVTDVDMLTNQMWVQVQSFFGQQIANAFASNGAFVINSLDSLAGSADLIGVRSRASYTRPFTKVEELRVSAEARFRETEQRLQNELAETEQRLGELQSSREDSGNILMTNEQQEEIDRFIDQRASIRTELRAVQRGLDKDIQQLGTRLQFINIALVPVLLTIFVLFAVWRRRNN
jgi:ABC-type uncharacterized transport system involved in gliding motility auxiliary subunit